MKVFSVNESIKNIPFSTICVITRFEFLVFEDALRLLFSPPRNRVGPQYHPHRQQAPQQHLRPRRQGAEVAGGVLVALGLVQLVHVCKSSGTVLFDSSTRCEGSFSMIGKESTRTVPGDYVLTIWEISHIIFMTA